MSYASTTIALGDGSHIAGEIVEVVSAPAYPSSESLTAFVRIRRPDQTVTWLSHFGQAARNPGWQISERGPVTEIAAKETP